MLKVNAINPFSGKWLLITVGRDRLLFLWGALCGCSPQDPDIKSEQLNNGLLLLQHTRSDGSIGRQGQAPAQVLLAGPSQSSLQRKVLSGAKRTLWPKPLGWEAARRNTARVFQNSAKRESSSQPKEREQNPTTRPGEKEVESWQLGAQASKRFDFNSS